MKVSLCKWPLEFMCCALTRRCRWCVRRLSDLVWPRRIPGGVGGRSGGQLWMPTLDCWQECEGDLRPSGKVSREARRRATTRAPWVKTRRLPRCNESESLQMAPRIYVLRTYAALSLVCSQVERPGVAQAHSRRGGREEWRAAVDANPGLLARMRRRLAAKWQGVAGGQAQSHYTGAMGQDSAPAQVQ